LNQFGNVVEIEGVELIGEFFLSVGGERIEESEYLFLADGFEFGLEIRGGHDFEILPCAIDRTNGFVPIEHRSGSAVPMMHNGEDEASYPDCQQDPTDCFLGAGSGEESTTDEEYDAKQGEGREEPAMGFDVNRGNGRGVLGFAFLKVR
jgi:hypothetical protein